MQRMLGYIRRAVEEFEMIESGDRVAVGVSGGKDSLVLLYGLHGLRRFYSKPFELVAITLDPHFGGKPGNYQPVADICAQLNIPYILKDTNIGDVVFNIRKEKRPCSLCAKLRRGALHEATRAAGCNKLALGHHNDDVVETFLMNLFIEGRVGCFQPINHLSRRDIYLIRPLLFAPEKEIRTCANRNNFPIVKSVCPVDGHTRRSEMKDFVTEQNRFRKGFSERIFGALRRSGVDGWGYRGPLADRISYREDLKRFSPEALAMMAAMTAEDKADKLIKPSNLFEFEGDNCNV